ncbi:unnamed protein product, partial [Porites lobata]
SRQSIVRTKTTALVKFLRARNSVRETSQLPIDILLLTVKDWEFLACMSCLNRDFCRSYCEELRQDVYLGKIGNDDMLPKIAVVKCYTGSTVPQGSWVTVTNAVKVLKPKAVIGVGCCGGLDPAKFKLGDVVVSVKLITYSSFKVTDKGITERGVRVPLRSDISKLMLTAAHGWNAPLKNPKEFEVDMHLGVFLSGPESVDSSARREELKERFSEADVIEMEGEGKPGRKLIWLYVPRLKKSAFTVVNCQDLKDEAERVIGCIIEVNIITEGKRQLGVLVLIKEKELLKPRAATLCFSNYSMQMTEGTLNVFRFSSMYILFTHHDGEEMSDVTGTLAGKDVAERPTVMQPRKRDFKRYRRIRRKNRIQYT